MDGEKGPGAGNQAAVLSTRRGDNMSMEYQETMTAIRDFFATDGRARGHKSERQDKFDSLMRELHQYASAFQLRFLYGIAGPRSASDLPDGEDDMEAFMRAEDRVRDRVRKQCRASAYLVDENPASKAWNQWIAITDAPRDVEAARIFQAAGIPAIGMPWNPPKIAAKMPWPPEDGEEELIGDLEEKPRKKGAKYRKLARILHKYAQPGEPWIIIQDNTQDN